MIIVAGPGGLACAKELERLGCRDWLILERTDHAGGLASSVVDSAGFTWDPSGHVCSTTLGSSTRALLSRGAHTYDLMS